MKDSMSCVPMALIGEIEVLKKRTDDTMTTTLLRELTTVMAGGAPSILIEKLFHVIRRINKHHRKKQHYRIESLRYP